MKVVSILAQKGGVGKSTLTRHWAVAAQEQMGLAVAVIDLDPQGTAAKWSQRRQQENPIVLQATETNLPQALAACRENGLGLVLIDTPPKVERLSQAAVRQADIAVIPCGPTVDDIEALEPSIEIVRQAKAQGLIVLNDGRPGSPINDQAAKVLRDYQLPICPHFIMHRAVIADSFIDGRTVLEVSPQSKGAQEISDSWRWIARKAGIERQKTQRRKNS